MAGARELIARTWVGLGLGLGLGIGLGLGFGLGLGLGLGWEGFDRERLGRS